jgi:sulfur carrier protein ThiS
MITPTAESHMNTESLQRLLMAIFNIDPYERASMTVAELIDELGIDPDSSCQTYEDACIMTNNLGVVVRSHTGETVQVTLIDAGVRQ